LQAKHSEEEQEWKLKITEEQLKFDEARAQRIDESCSERRKWQIQAQLAKMDASQLSESSAKKAYVEKEQETHAEKEQEV